MLWSNLSPRKLLLLQIGDRDGFHLESLMSSESQTGGGRDVTAAERKGSHQAQLGFGLMALWCYLGLFCRLLSGEMCRERERWQTVKSTETEMFW